MAADDLPRDQHFNGLVQERCKSSVLAMELCLYRTKPSIKGSNMIVCVLIFGVKLPRVLSSHAVWSRGRSPSDCPTARQHPRQASESPPPLVTKMRMLVFAGDWACEIELRQTGVICFPWQRRSLSCGVFKSWISDAHCPFQRKWQVLHKIWCIPASAGWYVFRWDHLLDEGLAFVQAGVPSCPDEVTLHSCMCEFQMWRRRCKQIDLHWFQWRQMRFCLMLSTMSWK